MKTGALLAGAAPWHGDATIPRPATFYEELRANTVLQERTHVRVENLFVEHCIRSAFERSAYEERPTRAHDRANDRQVQVLSRSDVWAC